jgi:hypothetical protein
MNKTRKPLNFWIGYSSLQLALGVCYANHDINGAKKLFLIKKSNRYIHKSLGLYRTHEYNWQSISWIIFNSIFSSSLIWLPGISPTSCSKFEKLAIRILFSLNKIRFYDDGMAGFTSHSYTWHHTLCQLPKAAGHLTWNQSERSEIFKNAIGVDVKAIKQIDPGIRLDCDTQKNIGIFIEANAMNIEKVYKAFIESAGQRDSNYYFAHTDKPSVSNQFCAQPLKTSDHVPIKLLNASQYMSLESLIIFLVDSASKVTIYSGCTSTILIILLYIVSSNQVGKLRVVYSPDYSKLHPEKKSQSLSFYHYINTCFGSSCLEL